MDDPVEHFAEIARKFCTWAEAQPAPEEIEVKSYGEREEFAWN